MRSLSFSLLVIMALTHARAAAGQPLPDAGSPDAPKTRQPTPGSASPPASDQTTEPEIEPVADDQPASDGAAPTPPLDASGVPELAAREPPLPWQAWDIGGDLSERERNVLRAFFAQPMHSQQPLTQDSRRELAAFARRIGYELVDIQDTQSASGERVAMLYLEPVTLVRRVEVTIKDNSIVEPFDAVFSDEITRRMRLRPGSPLERSPELRRQQFLRESQRIADYLRGEGYFEASVSVVATPAGKNAVELEVAIDKNARYQIGRVRVRGNQSITTGEIEAQFRHGQLCLLGYCLLQRFSRQRLNRDIQAVVALYQKRGFPAVRVRTDFDPGSSFDRSKKTVNFTVIINERRKIDVLFEGNQQPRFAPETLEGLLTFNSEGSYGDVEVIDSAEAIRQHYQSRGYFEANVTFERERFRFLERILFAIDAGPRLPVQRITFAGNQSIPSQELTRLLRTRVQNSSPVFGEAGYTTSTRLREDAQRVAQYYRSRGYIDVEVTVDVSRSDKVEDSAPTLAALVSARATTSGLYVRFLVDEGDRTFIQHIEFPGATLPRAALLRRLGFVEKQPYDSDRIERGRVELERFYFENAFPRADIAVSTAPGSAPGLVVLRYLVTENEQVSFGEVMVQGNFKTKEWLIRDELGFKPGQLLSLGRAENGPQNLRSSGLFNAVQVTFLGLDDGTDDRVNVLVQVEERHDYRLGGEAAIGFSTDRGLLVELGLQNPNVLGQGLRFDVRGQYATEFNAVGSFLDPESDFLSIEGKITAPRWITRRLTRGTFASQVEAVAFWRQEPTERFGALTSFGTSIGVSRLGRSGFFKDWLLSVRYDLRQRNLSQDLVRRAGPSDDIEEDESKATRTGSLGPQILIDKRRDEDGRPNPLTPARGFKFEVHALLAHRYLFGQDDFIKVGLSGQHFLEPSPRILLSNSIRYDQGIPLGDSVLLPEVERFFAGGDTTVRGFEEDRLATEIIESPVPPYQDVTHLQVLPAGGNIRFIHNIDLQIELSRWFNFPVASAIFLDTGLVTNSLDGFAVTDLRHALGVALFRWVTPLSSLSIEWAIPLDPKTGDDPRGRYHLNLGLLF